MNMKHAHMHCQSGLTALKVAQSEGHQNVCDILLQHSQQGSKVISPAPGESGSRQVEERKAEVGMDDSCTEIECQLVSFTL